MAQEQDNNSCNKAGWSDSIHGFLLTCLQFFFITAGWVSVQDAIFHRTLSEGYFRFHPRTKLVGTCPSDPLYVLYAADPGCRKKQLKPL